MHVTDLSPIRAVIFDMDGVLTNYDFDRRLSVLERESGIEVATIEEAIWHSGYDYEHDQGRHDAETYLAGVAKRLGRPISLETWLTARREAMRPNSEVLEIVRALTGKVKLATLTNNGHLLREAIGEVFPEFTELFGEHGYFSCQFGVAKPDAGAYHGVLERLDIPPNEALFIDDTDWCCRGAVDAGLHVHHFKGAEGLREDLVGRGIL
jgi:putative hydrolase of the HAD superfamily